MAEQREVEGIGTGTPESQCPKCREWVPDYDGFGVLAHGACGFCSHPSQTGGICDVCKEDIEE